MLNYFIDCLTFPAEKNKGYTGGCQMSALGNHLPKNSLQIPPHCSIELNYLHVREGGIRL